MVSAVEKSKSAKVMTSKNENVVCLDAGNGYFKLVGPSGQHISFVAAVKKLKSYEVDDIAEVGPNSALVTLEGQVYAFGELAKHLGGQSLFEAGKIGNTPVAVAAALALLGITEGSVKVRLLVPDAAKAEWRGAAKALPNQLTDFHARVGGGEFQRFGPKVEVQLVSEGYPVWHWATTTNQIPAALVNRPLIGVIDAGTGDLTCSVWNPSGNVVRSAGAGSGQVTFSTGAMKELAGQIGAGFAHLCQHTPDRGMILDIIREQAQVPVEDRRYVYEERGIPHSFTGIFQDAVKEWNHALMLRLQQDNWAQVLSQLSMVFIVGGACDLLAPMEAATKGRFKVVRLPYTEAQLTNAQLMTLMA